MFGTFFDDWFLAGLPWIASSRIYSKAEIAQLWPRVQANHTGKRVSEDGQR